MGLMSPISHLNSSWIRNGHTNMIVDLYNARYTNPCADRLTYTCTSRTSVSTSDIAFWYSFITGCNDNFQAVEAIEQLVVRLKFHGRTVTHHQRIFLQPSWFTMCRPTHTNPPLLLPTEKREHLGSFLPDIPFFFSFRLPANFLSSDFL
jgi:hypothetical protein